MKISLNWLGLFVDLSSVSKINNAREIAHTYSIHTAEIEGFESTKKIDKVVIGKVLTAERHPDSTKLWICRVNVGNSVEEIILTGAPNVYPGMFTAVALVGCQIAPDFVIGERKMAGMISRGMMCGADEIGLSNTNSGGIIDLNADFSVDFLETQIGNSVFDLEIEVLSANGETAKISLMDTVFEIDNKNITNRPDLFGIYGHSREFATVFGTARSKLDTSKLTLGGKTIHSDFSDVSSLKLDIETDKVYSYSLAKVSGITYKHSPFGVRLLLERSGHGTHDAIVDMTNYLMMELGQPMHAFDADTIEGNIVVRQAHAGESIVALDGKEYNLTQDDIVIADTKKVLAIAGVMGGLHTGISDTTKNIYIESAVFDPTSIRLTAQRLGLRSEASTRFEKSLDPTFSVIALKRAIQFLDFTKVGGELVGQTNYRNEQKVNKTELTLTHEFIESRIGISVEESEVLATLTSLEFSPVVNNKTYQVTVPPHRATKDVRIVEDIVEEVARIHGYDAVTETPIPGEFSMTEKNKFVALRNKIQNYFSSIGFYEAFNYSFSNEAKDEMVLKSDFTDAIRIQNAVSQDFTIMRRCLAPLLLGNAHENLKQLSQVKFFEIAKTHYKDSEGMHEDKTLAGVLTNTAVTEIRTILDGFFELLGASVEVVQGSNLPFLHPNTSGTYTSLTMNGQKVAYFGALHPKVLQNFELPPTTWYFEVDIASLISSISRESHYTEPNKYPSITRELNFVMDKTASTGDVAKLISSVDSRIHSLAVVDTYEHEKIGIGKKSVTFSFVVEDTTKTITDVEAGELQNKIIESLEKQSIYLRR